MEKFLEYASFHNFDYPTLLLDKTIVESNFINFQKHLPLNSKILYAVKANPHPDFLTTLDNLNSFFDAASWGEINNCLKLGINAKAICFGNTIKSTEDIKRAYKYGISTFMADSCQELNKISHYAPNSNIFIRMAIADTNADWPLGKKFGANVEYIPTLVAHAISLGLDVKGISFHVGSQNNNIEDYSKAISLADKVIRYIRNTQCYGIKIINIGGGFPINYSLAKHDINVAISSFYQKSFIERLGEVLKNYSKEYDIWCEPGRAIAASAGLIVAKVLLVADRGIDQTRWVYLNIGRFHGLAETESEAIKYEFIVPKYKNTTNYESFCVAGPTCDSADILYYKNKRLMPKDISYNDTVLIPNTGVYTSTYSSIGFNGFPPLEVISI